MLGFPRAYLFTFDRQPFIGAWVGRRWRIRRFKGARSRLWLATLLANSNWSRPALVNLELRG